VSSYIDLTRITQLQEFMGDEAGSMLGTMVSSLTGAIERLEAAVSAGELEAAIQAAHSARNDALMLGADALQAALRELEAAARDADEAGTRAMLEQVREVWPPTREELTSL
jgi:HPt (histidine-containing phosphotransfer) domain-containing protein